MDAAALSAQHLGSPLSEQAKMCVRPGPQSEFLLFISLGTEPRVLQALYHRNHHHFGLLFCF
jgi:hypothetical protein